MYKNNILLGLSIYSPAVLAAEFGTGVWGSAVWSASEVQVPIPLWALILLAITIGYFARKTLSRGATIAVIACVFLVPYVGAQVTLPHIFQNGTVIDADEVNNNFTALNNELGNKADISGAGSLQVSNIGLPRYELAENDIVYLEQAEGFFFIVAGGGVHYAFGFREINANTVIINQSGLFSTTPGTASKINVFDGGAPDHQFAIQSKLSTGSNATAVYAGIIGAVL